MESLRKHSIAIVFGVIVFCGAGTSQTLVPERGRSDSQGILGGEVVDQSTSSVTIEVSVTNTRDTTIFIATRPTTLNGNEEPFFAFEGDDFTLLKVGVQVFDKSQMEFYGNASGVVLYALEPKATMKIPIVIENGRQETLPRYDSGYRALNKVRLDLLKKVRISVGYFDNPEVSHISNRRVNGQSVVHLDHVKSVSLYELQNLAELEIQI